MPFPDKHGGTFGKKKRKPQEDDAPAFPGARFPISQLPRTDDPSVTGSRAYSLTHPVKGGPATRNLNEPVPDLGTAIHIHLHSGPSDMTGNYQKAARLMNKRRKGK